MPDTDPRPERVHLIAYQGVSRLDATLGSGNCGDRSAPIARGVVRSVIMGGYGHGGAEEQD